MTPSTRTVSQTDGGPGCDQCRVWPRHGEDGRLRNREAMGDAFRKPLPKVHHAMG